MKGTIVYYGGFSLPDKNAAANRVVSNGKIFEALGYNVIFLGADYDGSGYNYKLTGHGGAIAFDIGAHDAVIKNSEFTYNYARRDGGAINIAENSYNASIENCIFTNNSCGDDGGAINWEGDLGFIQNITCYNNTGKAYNDEVTGASTSKGGTICLTGSNVTIDKSSFDTSSVKVDGGALFITGNDVKVLRIFFVIMEDTLVFRRK